MSTTSLVSSWRARTEAELLLQQLRGIDRFHRARRAVHDEDDGPLTREGRLDAARARDALARTHEALVAHVDRSLTEAGAPWPSVARRRMVVAHRNAWFGGKVAEALAPHDVHLVVQVDNGADAVGVAVAEQPDLLLVEDALPMVAGPRVVAEVRDLCPGTVVAGQVEHAGRLAALLDAGAVAAFVRRQPPAEVATALLELLRPADQHLLNGRAAT